MAEIRWQFDPTPLERFPLGASPFRVRGLAYVAVLEYMKKRTPGGVQSVQAALAGDPALDYITQLFVSLGDYDVVPLARLFNTATKLEATPVGRFIEERAKSSARSDSDGIWRALLSSKTLSQMVERLPITFNRYFEPCRASIVRGTDRSFTGDLSDVPSTLNGVYVFSTQGFVGTCLELSGAKNVTFEWNRPTPTGEQDGIPVECVRFTARWD